MNNAMLLTKKDQELISMSAEEEVNFWANKWGVTKETVKSAVKFSGSNSVSQVYTYLVKSKKVHLS
ncbi:MAG: DUF3606 domain-containing protein [Pedobacter sp.]|nr:MAG: DUF3606 domain-containing protein [Pedobacter sp.]